MDDLEDEAFFALVAEFLGGFTDLFGEGCVVLFDHVDSWEKTDDEGSEDWLIVNSDLSDVELLETSSQKLFLLKAFLGVSQQRPSHP